MRQIYNNNHNKAHKHTRTQRKTPQKKFLSNKINIKEIGCKQ